MTVGELIEELQKFPRDFEARIPEDYLRMETPRWIEKSEHGPYVNIQ